MTKEYKKNKWFKFYGGEYLSDPKMLSLSPSERSCWLTLLCYACAEDDNGMIRFLDEEKLMTQSNLETTKDEWEETTGVLKKFEKLKMITLDNEIIIIKNWKIRQERALTGYERVKKYRDKKKIPTHDTKDNKVITKVITTDKIRRDKIRRDKNINISLNRQLQAKPANKKLTKISPIENGIIKIKALKETYKIDFNQIDVVDILPKEKQTKEKIEGKQINIIFDIFYLTINPGINYGNKTTRSSAEWLIKNYGMDEALKSVLIAVLAQSHTMPFAPTITTPFQLKEKLASLNSFILRRKNKSGERAKGFNLDDAQVD